MEGEMAKEVVEVWTPNDMEEMMDALEQALSLAWGEGHHPHVVHPNKHRVTLVRETLTDGSHVMNLNFFDGE
jgi:hypothetical protein